MTFSFTPGYNKCIVPPKRISRCWSHIGRKHCSGDELSLSILVRVHIVASSLLSLNVGRVEFGMPVI